MNGLFRRYLVVIVRFLPFALSFLRDRRRFVLFGSRRQVPDEKHRQRAEQIRDTMLELGPAFIKVGQVLSTRPDIVPPVYADVFGTLQDEVPEGAGGDPKHVVAEELGDELDQSTLEPVAGGSLAYVYTADYRGERIALKVRRPELKPVITRDLRVVRGLLPLIRPFATERQQYSIQNAADDFEDIILNELDFKREATIMADIRENFDDDERVVIPAIYEDLCSERVLAMEYLTGRKITDDDAFDDVDVTPHEMATRIINVYLEMGLVDGVFHADPHPGNLGVTDDGHLLLFDFGMSERLPPTVQDDIIALYRALVRRDVDDLVDALIALDVLEPHVNRAEVGRVLELVIENLEGQSEITWRQIITELTTTLRAFPFRIPPDVMLLIRVGTVGEGVCRQLDPEFDFLAAVRSFLVEQNLIESELDAIIEETWADVRRSLPALARVPSRVDRTLYRLERGELVVRTEPADGHGIGERNLGYAVIAGALIVAAAILTFHQRPYEIPVLAVAAGFLLVYLVDIES
ncbi:MULTISPECIES: AarF/ABC1/UbiB kinase family protein [unclassified Haloarcula]|uniref:ABC1 kinase family protein n=1 Tax=unclassified Haloarcula TaxID=2624677 RepID=UPI0005955663|nr:MULTISPECIES: AarF/UbiB family protein [unclassified Haloarcula]AJF24302.1 ABC transporter [Haloarcula sp. CBA1115]KAA9400885.1 AarF/ABC1/UbiB kinase family protein [Haloarcula sp. CBA1131]KZX50034.1 ABC transporter [Haloarcula sp. K1]MUV48507.1 AarF/ABC1/UbiB kinase family protein [Haloarcula sp. CBA1122]